MDDEIRNRLKALRDKLAPVPGFPHVLASGADITELIDCLVAMNPKPKVKVTITNNIAAEDRVGESCAKLAAAEERLAQARAANWGAVRISLDRRVAKPPQDWSGLNSKRPWWKFWA